MNPERLFEHGPRLRMDDNLNKLLLKNTFTNYAYLAVRMGAAIFLTRIIYLGLGNQFYGFWSLLWAIFGYSLLLDFGFGKTVQKYTAEATITADMNAYSKIISAVFFSYLLMSLVIIAAAVGMVFFLENIFTMDMGDQRWYHRTVFIVFAVGVATVFPSGIFPEILVGMKKLYLRNYVMVFNKLLELVGIWLIFRLNGSLLALAIFSTVLNLSTNIVMAILVFRLIPGLRISLRLFDYGTLRSIADFSLFAYMVTIANMVIFRTDRILLGIMVGMGGVAVYQLGTRIPEIVEFLTSQFQENLSPLAASLHKAGDQARLRSVMLSSSRLIVFLTTCVFVVFGCLAREIMFVWLKVTAENIIWTAYVMLLSVYITVVCRSTTDHFLLMTGRHRFLAVLAVCESIANLTLTIFLVCRFGVIGAAVGTLVPNMLIGLFVVLPVAARYLNIRVTTYLFRVYLPALFICIPSMAFVWWISEAIPLEEWNLPKLAVTTVAAGFIYLVVGWTIYVRPQDKPRLLALLPASTPRKLIALLGGEA